MHARLPSVRNPRSFYDIFAVIAIATTLAALVLTVWHGTIVRIEMAAFTGLVFLWGAWAVYNTLARSVDRKRR